jgi:hypothetical protein
MKYGEEAVCALLDALNSNNVAYMLVGSFSSNAYGEPRSTKDADFVVDMDADQRRAVLAALPSDFQVDWQTSFETITGHTRQIIHIPSVPFEIELFDLSSEPFDQSRFSRRLKTSMLDKAVWLPTAEDVLVQKLRWSKLGARMKDFLDARAILQVRADRLDWTYIEEWCEQLGISDELLRARESI